MAVTIKTSAEIRLIKEGGKRLGEILERLADEVAAGNVVSTAQIDELAEKWIIDSGGKPAFKGYGKSQCPFPATICVSVNDEVVHGVPSHEHSLHEGDVVGLDIGMVYPVAGRGLYTDTAVTVAVGKTSAAAETLIARTYESLRRAIDVVREGAYVSDVGRAVEGYIRPFGYGIIRDYVGHGVGHEVHEEPRIPNFVEPRLPEVEFKAGMVIAIEPMIAAGSWRVVTAADGWTVKTVDGSIAAHFEHTVVVTHESAEVVTARPSEHL